MLSCQVNAAADLLVIAGLFANETGAPGTMGTNTVAPVPGSEGSD